MNLNLIVMLVTYGGYRKRSKREIENEKEESE
jgi:hypothetical protein